MPVYNVTIGAMDIWESTSRKKVWKKKVRIKVRAPNKWTAQRQALVTARKRFGIDGAVGRVDASK